VLSRSASYEIERKKFRSFRSFRSRAEIGHMADIDPLKISKLFVLAGGCDDEKYGYPKEAVFLVV
jgi:hypothetical protein